MQNAVQLIRNEEFDKIRVVIIDDEVWFVAVDVCRVLGLKNIRQNLAKLDDDEKKRINLNEVSTNGVTNSVYNTYAIADAVSGGWIDNTVNVVNEAGLYHLIFMSKKPEAKKLRRWVFHEVLPSIRKYGFYSPTKETPVKQISDKSRRAIKKINDEYPDDDIEFLGITSESNGSGNQYCFGLSKDFALKLLDELAEEK